MMKKPTLRASVAYFALAALLPASPGLAAEGIELIGYGARQKALAGADVADSRDPMSMSVNPAGIVGLDTELQVGMTALLPDRGYEATGPLVVLAPGYVDSGQPIFPVPNGGFVKRIDAESAWGVVVYGNGGINTSYGQGNFKPPIYAPNLTIPGLGTIPGPLISGSAGGPFGGGFAGIDLRQSFFSVDGINPAIHRFFVRLEKLIEVLIFHDREGMAATPLRQEQLPIIYRSLIALSQPRNSLPEVRRLHAGKAKSNPPIRSLSSVGIERRTLRPRP